MAGERQPLSGDEVAGSRHVVERAEDQLLIVGEDEDDVGSGGWGGGGHQTRTACEEHEEDQENRATEEDHSPRVDEPQRARNCPSAAASVPYRCRRWHTLRGPAFSLTI